MEAATSTPVICGFPKLKPNLLRLIRSYQNVRKIAVNRRPMCFLQSFAGNLRERWNQNWKRLINYIMYSASRQRI